MPKMLPAPPLLFPSLSSIPAITDEEFDAIRELLYRQAGISMSDAKRALVCSRLARRLRHLHLQSHSEYLEYLETRDPQGLERQEMINCLTTNKTDFFREPHHFRFLRDVVFPQIHERAARGGPRRLRIWSAGCSMGDEPYTIAMTIRDHFGPLRGWDVRVLATDINTSVLETAQRGIYALERIAGLGEDLRRRHFLCGTGDYRGYCQVRPEVRRLVTFRRLNFADASWPIHAKFDVIFCRNVIIYFNAQTQRQLVPRFADYLSDDGYLMLGHSENLHWLTEIFAPLGNTIYQCRGQKSPTASKPSPPHGAGPKMSTPLRRGGRSLLEEGRLARQEIIAGEYYASREPVEISTMLGSCVAACLFDPVTRVGGMNHFLLPCHALDCTTSARYGVHAMELLINQIMRLGGDRRRLRAKVFGGANVLHREGHTIDVGQQNVAFIRHFLATEGIPILAERLGGESPLRLHFATATGRVLVKALRGQRGLLERETRYSEEAAVSIEETAPDSVTLF